MQKTPFQPSMADALYNSGLGYLSRKKFSKACELLEKSTKLNPKFINAWYNLGLSYKKLPNIKKAIQAFTEVATLQPSSAAANFQLACLYMQVKNFPDAQNRLLTTLEIWPEHPESLINLASCYLMQNQPNDAKKYYEKALTITPTDTQILFNLAVIYNQLGQTDQAIQHYQRTILADNDFFAAHYNLGLLFLAKQLTPFALQSFEAAHQLKPENSTVNHLINSIKDNPQTDSAPSDHLALLFDNYADHYDEHLLTGLQYAIPKLFLHAAKKNLPRLQNSAILDIGCGTGLSGEPFKDISKYIYGVDLSEKMLHEAHKKNIYAELFKENFHDFLLKHKARYDLILAGDVLVYLGDLNKLFTAAHSSLRNNGSFIFNTEISKTRDYQIKPSGRFGHSAKYLNFLAKRYNFNITIENITSRLQHEMQVNGFLCILKKIQLLPNIFKITE